MMIRLGPLALSLLLLGPSLTLAASDEPLGRQVTSKRTLTPEEQAQEQARKVCKIEICDIFTTEEQQGPDVACDIGWTWHADEIVDALGGRVDWPWGKAVCQSKLRLARAPLARAMSDRNYKLAAETQTVRCALHQKDGKPYVIEIDLAPRVTFRNGKATDARINWGDVSAPAAIYPLLYAATGLDNSTNVLGPEAVRQINKFIRKDCADVEDELPGRRVN